MSIQSSDDMFVFVNLFMYVCMYVLHVSVGTFEVVGTFVVVGTSDPGGSFYACCCTQYAILNSTLQLIFTLYLHLLVVI